MISLFRGRLEGQSGEGGGETRWEELLPGRSRFVASFASPLLAALLLTKVVRQKPLLIATWSNVVYAV